MITLPDVLLGLGWGMLAAEMSFLYLIPHWMTSSRAIFRIKMAGGGAVACAISLFIVSGLLQP